MSGMFCYQCEQTAKGTGCTIAGVCGKEPRVAALLDLLIHAAKGISQYAHRARQLGASDRRIDVFVIEALFTTVTNVNFDPARLAEMLGRAAKIRDAARALYEDASRRAGKEPESPPGPAEWSPAGGLDELIRQGEQVTIAKRLEALGADTTGLQELLTYGLKGTAAYADHAQILGEEDDEVYSFFHEALDFLAGNPADTDELLAMVLRCGEVNLKVMGMLDAANTAAYGSPVPTPVRITPAAGKCI